MARRRVGVSSPGKTINSARSRISLVRCLGMWLQFCGSFLYLAPVSAVHLKDEYSPFVGVNYVGGVFLRSLRIFLTN